MLLPIAAGLGALVVAGYNTMSPTSQLYGRTFIREGRGSRRLALTFDDGPNDPHTLHLLDVLAKHQVKATFFVIGKYVRQRPDIVRELHSAGHVIGNHTSTHPNLVFRSRGQTQDEIGRCEFAIQDAIRPLYDDPNILFRNAHQGKDDLADRSGAMPETMMFSGLFRPPYGGRRPSTLRAIRDLGYDTIMWSVSGHDWSATSSRQIVEKVARQGKGGDVILLHDGGHKHFGTDRSLTVQATDELIRRYTGEGYGFVTVSEMMGGASGVRHQASGNPDRDRLQPDA